MYYPPLKPRAYAASQYAGTAAAALLALSAPLQILIALTVRGAGLFIITAALSLLLIWPLLLFLRATPPVTLDARGIMLMPKAGRAVFIPWDSIREVKQYPLLPPSEAETVRRAAVGRRNYAPAEGLLLTSDALPWPYRAVGFFAGEGLHAAFAVTNRAQANYPALKTAIKRAAK